MSDDSPGVVGYVVGFVVLVAVVFAVIGGGAWLFSFKGTDSGEVCVVREGGPFDGRDITEVRQPGSGPKPIGAFNHQDCLPTTERDSNDVIEDQDKDADGKQLPTFPTADRVQVIADGQVLFSLTTDEQKIKSFYKKYGRRKWDGKEIGTEEGWLNFLQQRLQPVILDATRETIGQYQCVQLNNLCEYVQNPETVGKGGKGDTNNTQNLAEAQRKLADSIKAKIVASFGTDHPFENIRVQNLRIRFEDKVNDRITEAQTLRTEAANAKLEADRKTAEARGEANKRVEEARGLRRAAKEQARANRLNPNQPVIDRIRAFCGADGCDPQVFGSGNVISQLGK